MAKYSILRGLRANLPASTAKTEEWAVAQRALERIEEALADIDKRLIALEDGQQ